MNKRIGYINTIKQLRLPLIVLISFAHSYSGVRVGYTLWGDGWDTYEVLKIVVSQTLCKVAMPTFFVMSGYLFFANVTEWNAKTYLGKLRRRVKTLLIPYIVWNLLMAIKLRTFSLNIFWAFWSEAGKQIDWLGNEQLMTAPANMPLWFLRDLMVMALLSPIIYIGIRKMGGWLLIILTPLYLSGFCAFIPGLSAYAVYFFTLGAFLGIRKMDIVETCMKYEKPSYILATIFGLAMICTFRTPVFSSLMLCFRLVGVVAVFCLANRLLSRTPKRIPQMACDASYFVYLAHYVFFFAFIDTAFFSLFGTSSPSMCIHYLACPLLKVVILFGIYIVYRLVVPAFRLG
jgi:fucose 4-O-acetylase-like acetyltransferase